MNVTFRDKNINFTTRYKYLGCIIEPNLSMGSNFESSYKKASSRLRLLHKLRPYMTADACATFYKSMVVPVFTYCGFLHLMKPQSLIYKSNRLHERACRIIANHKISNNIKSPELIIKSRALMTVRKCIEGEICSNFKNYFETNEHMRNTRNNGKLLKLPKLRLEYFRGSFFYAGAKLYNELPHEVKELTMTKFKACI